MTYDLNRTIGICLLLAAWISVSFAESKTEDSPPAEEDVPAVAYERAPTWAETVRVNRSALFEYKNSFIFSANDVTPDANAIPIDVEISDRQTLWLVANRRGQAVWCSPQLVREDGTTLSLTTLEPFSQEVGRGELKVDTAVVAGQNFPESLLAPAASRIGYRLDGQYTRFKAGVGLNESSRNGNVDFYVCTAPVFEMLDESAEKLFAGIDADFPDHARGLLVNGIEGERCEFLYHEDPLTLLKKATENALDQVKPYGVPYREGAKDLDDEGTVEQRLELLDRVLELQTNLFHIRDQIKQVVPVLTRFTRDFSLELELLSERATYLQTHMDSQVLGTFKPVSEIEQIENELTMIESHRLSGDALPLERLKILGDQAKALAERLDQFVGWPAVRRDNHRSGISYEHIQLPLHRDWVHTPNLEPKPAWPPPARVNRAVKSDPLDPTLTYDRAFHTVVHDGLVYYGSSADDSVHCLELTTGKELWTYTTNGPIRLAPALYAGKCYVGSDDGYLYCLNGKTGALIWKFRAGPETPWVAGNGRIISSFPVRCGICVSEDIVYFAAGLFPRQGTFLCALNAENGEEIFVEPLTCSPQGYMLLTPTKIMVSTGRTPFVMCDRKTGKLVEQLGTSSSWGQDLKGGSFAVVIEDRVATGPSEDGHLHLFNSERIKSVFRSVGQQVLVCGSTAYILRKDGLFAIDRRKYLLEKEESLKWRVHGEQSHCMIMAGDTVFCGAEGGVYAIHATTGARLWTTAVEGRVEGLAVSLGRLLVNTSTGKTYCFSERPPSHTVADDTRPESSIAIDSQTKQLASDLVSLAKVKKGYLLLQNYGDVRLAAQLALISDFRIICAETDREKIDRMRTQLLDAGLYGRQIVCHHWPTGVSPYQRYLFNAIMINVENGSVLSETQYQSIQRQLRPHGGLLAIFGQSRDQLRPFGHQTEWFPGDTRGTRFAYQYRGALIGEGTWTHPYADPGNSACSNDQFSFANTTIQWFGAPGPRNIVDRHQKSPPPVYAQGRVFVTGSDYIVAVDAYNGTILWENKLAESGRVRIMGNCGNMVAMDDRLYVAHSGFCTAFDAQTGQQVFQTSTEQLNTEWGYLAHVNGVLLGSSGRSGSMNRPLLRRWPDMKLQEGSFSCSYELFACDPKTGKRLWRYRPQHGAIINPAIACSGNRVCFLESLNPKTLQTEIGRTDLKTLLEKGVRFVALDITTGQQAWEAKPDMQNVQHIVYLSATPDTVIVTGSCHVEVGNAIKNRYSMIAYDSATGQQRWASLEVPGYEDATDGNHGALRQHPVIVGDIVYGNGYARYLQTGEEYAGWKWTKSHKCATLSASGRCAFSRYERTKLPFMFDLESGTRQALTTVSRPGCWINMLPVGGLIVIPEGSAGCTCGYSIQTSLALSPEPVIAQATSP